jgi:hypothetical protein
VTFITVYITAGQRLDPAFTLANIFCWGVYRHRRQNSTTPGARFLSNCAVKVDSWTVCGLMSMVFGKEIGAD